MLFLIKKQSSMSHAAFYSRWVLTRGAVKRLMIASAALTTLVACQANEPYVIGDGASAISFGGAGQDALPLSISVREALTKHPRTKLSNIEVSSPNDETVRLTGVVNDDATRHEAERIASSVPGVRFVVNTLEIK